MADIDGGTLAALISAAATIAGALGVAIRWSAGIIADEMKATREIIKGNTDAFAAMKEFLGRVDVRTETTNSRVVEIHHEISGVHEAATVQDLPDAEPTPVDITPARPTPRPGTYGAAKDRRRP